MQNGSRNQNWQYGRTDHSTSPDRFARRSDLSEIDLGANRTGCNPRPQARSSQRRGFGRTRGPDHSILCRHFKRIGGCAADVRNRNAYFDFQRWSVHRRDQYAFGPSCDGAYSCSTRCRSHPARSRKPPRSGANRRGAERDPDACVHSSAGGIASARYWRCNTPRLQSFGRYPSHQGILHAQWPPVYVHRSGTRRRRSEPPGSLPCLCR